MTSLLHACRTWVLWRSVHKDIVPQTVEDIDIVANICQHQKDGEALTVNQLVENSIASRNTVLRRLRALVGDGIVRMRSSLDDKRFKELSLTSKGVALVRKAATSLKRFGAALRAAK